MDLPSSGSLPCGDCRASFSTPHCRHQERGAAGGECGGGGCAADTRGVWLWGQPNALQFACALKGTPWQTIRHMPSCNSRHSL